MRRKEPQAGSTLIETMIATAICMVVVFGLAGLVTMSTRQAKDMGSTVALATSLAGQKMDQLLTMNYTATSPVCGTGNCINQNLCPCLAAAIPCSCGNLNSNGTAGGVNYFEFLDANGAVMPTATATTNGVYFVRRWRSQALTALGPTMRLIEVRVEGRAIGRTSNFTTSNSGAPSAIVACLKAQL
ncbi:MAG: type IV pilus modification PilV family protein [Anaerolineales bacterium]